MRAVLLACGVMALVAACASTPPPMESMKARHTVDRVRVVVLDESGGQVIGTVSKLTVFRSTQNGKISAEQEARIVALGDALLTEFERGLRDDFPARAQDAGLAVHADTASPELRFVVQRQELECERFACMVRMHVRGDVVDPGGTLVWSSLGQFGQTTYTETVDAAMSARYAQQVLAQMRADGLIGSGAR